MISASKTTNTMTLTPEANIHVTSNDESCIANKNFKNLNGIEDGEISTGKISGSKESSTAITWERKFEANPHRDCTLSGNVCHKYPENFGPLKFTNLF